MLCMAGKVVTDGARLGEELPNQLFRHLHGAEMTLSDSGVADE